MPRTPKGLWGLGTPPPSRRRHHWGWRAGSNPQPHSCLPCPVSHPWCQGGGEGHSHPMGWGQCPRDLLGTRKTFPPPPPSPRTPPLFPINLHLCDLWRACLEEEEGAGAQGPTHSQKPPPNSIYTSHPPPNPPTKDRVPHPNSPSPFYRVCLGPKGLGVHSFCSMFTPLF